MKEDFSVAPHGGALVNLVVDEERHKVLKQLATSLQDVTLNERQLCDLELIANGTFSPLEGFMTRPDFEAVLDRMRLQSGELWPLPICLDITELQAKAFEVGQSVVLRDPEGYLLAILHVQDIWPVDRAREAQAIYGTNDTSHPGVEYLFRKTGDFYMGGRLEVLNLPVHYDFEELRNTPAEIRSSYERCSWQRVVGFETRNPIHRPHFELTLEAMRQARAKLLVLPVAGIRTPGDFDHYTRIKCYKAISHHYPPNSFMVNLLPLATRFSGPRDALLDVIIAKNYGCTHFIVGHNHASPGLDQNGRPFYDSVTAQSLAEEYGGELGVQVLSFKEMVYLPLEDEYRFVDQVPDGLQTVSLSGSELRRRFYTGRRIPEWATLPEVMTELQKAHPPPRRQGFTIFLTGLSGAGKSTIARVLYSRFLEIGDRPVTLLDGDIVRQNLSSELSFSKEHRDINVRRIGFVASEITKNRGVAICAPIAPYTTTRREIRQGIEHYGGFIEVHVATPIEVCERRDRKGMYAKARAGLIKGYTGVDDPYEEPQNPEVFIDTTNITPDEAAQEVLLFLSQKGYI